MSPPAGACDGVDPAPAADGAPSAPATPEVPPGAPDGVRPVTGMLVGVLLPELPDGVPSGRVLL